MRSLPYCTYGLTSLEIFPGWPTPTPPSEIPLILCMGQHSFTLLHASADTYLHTRPTPTTT
ncbi:hypothetical protein PAXRUDRAFT_835181 [Paxillus rubicundulus Ve08.2h10]|uniref:Uncharacterized protein n=1 Tax=Paxillus rubicundulus Ve08.2h10 TaxID=930991 RepID=A0A0D0D933_9AGAM|nr:hypothetical protein PAXRUDRAFT_835181 [Paxillus rubicundulus Ve08.2h10]